MGNFNPFHEAGKSAYKEPWESRNWVGKSLLPFKKTLPQGVFPPCEGTITFAETREATTVRQPLEIQ